MILAGYDDTEFKQVLLSEYVRVAVLLRDAHRVIALLEPRKVALAKVIKVYGLEIPDDAA